MTGQRPLPEKLWALTPTEFNEWRATNDLPILFEQLKQLLPGFSAWLSGLPFSEEVVLKIVPTGSVFKSGKTRFAIRREGDYPNETIIECSDLPSIKEIKEYWAERKKIVEIFGCFEPYFTWAKRNLRRKRFFTYDAANSQRTDTFLFGSWRGLSNGQTKAYLFQHIEVVKLGQVTLLDGLRIEHRNLDFADLDYIKVTGGFHGSTWKTINFSSCRGITFEGADLAFLTFHRCATDQVLVHKSNLQDIYFEMTDVAKFVAEDSSLLKIGVVESRFKPFILNCTLKEFKFSPSWRLSADDISDTFRLIRIAYQAIGMRAEASEAYFKERVYERKAYFSPYARQSNKRQFPHIGYEGRFSSIFRLWLENDISISSISKAVRHVLRGRLRILVRPKYLLRLLKFKAKWLGSFVESAVWGYGERPMRILCFASTIIASYAVAFHLIGWVADRPHPSGWLDSIYFSIVTFTTLGYGDFAPTTSTLKAICASEALTGAFTMGLVVAGFSNRGRY